jgi:uncharacterized membrane protein
MMDRDETMYPKRVFSLAAAALLAASLAGAAVAQTAPSGDQPKQTGLWLTTDFPELTGELGNPSRIDLSIKNSNLPPERVQLSVEDLPSGWDWKLSGGGHDVTAAIVGSDETRDLTLTLTPPKDAKAGTVSFRVVGHAPDQTLTLPITMQLTAAKPAALDLSPELPALRGSPTSSFDFQVAIKNDSPNDATVNLVAQAPDGFTTTFQEQYGTQQLTSLPIKAGESKTVKVSVQPPHEAAAGDYPIVMQATSPQANASTQLVAQVTGQPALALTGPNGRLSGEATAGKAETFTFNIGNTGSAPAKNVRFTANAPSGWKVSFRPDQMPGLDTSGAQPLQVEITPSEKAIAGDYMVTIRANGDGASDSADFRVTVTTSTIWGVAGLGIIAAAVLVLALAVARYGRR